MSFNVGKLFHVIHMSDAVAPLDDWYDDVFFPRRGVMDGNQAPSLKRDASLLVIADIIIEPDVKQFVWDDFTKTPGMVAAGEAAALAALPQIRAALTSGKHGSAE